MCRRLATVTYLSFLVSSNPYLFDLLGERVNPP
jgi:hypothetical protein